MCPPVILLSTWTMEEQLAWPSCTLQHGVEERMMLAAFRFLKRINRKKMNKSKYFVIHFSIYLLCLSICLSIYLSTCLILPSLPRVSSGALLAPVLHPSSWFNTGTDVVESLRGPLVPLVPQQGLGAAGEDFSNQFYWSFAIGLTQQGQAKSPAAPQCMCVSVCVCVYV